MSLRTFSLRALVLAPFAAAALFVVLHGQEAQAATTPTCTAPEYLKDGACVPSDPGHFVADDGATTQTPCPRGQYQDEAGKKSCKDIPLGSGGTGALEDGTRATGVAQCAPGTFRGDVSTTRCAPAPAGSFVATAGAQVAEQCALGRFQDEPGRTSCKEAPIGTFVAARGATAATPCPAGRYQDATAQSECRVIPLGSGGTGALENGTRATGVAQCTPGTFRGDPATTPCAPAPAGSFVANAGATSATPCPTGRFQPETGKSSCDPAPAGSHVPVVGSTAAALCPAGTFTSTTGATTCTPAQVGYYVPRPGSTEQLRCVTATEPGLSRCPAPTAAPTAPSTEGPATGDEPLSPQGDECPPGTWSATGTSRAGSTCTPASPGRFVADAGATAEQPCPIGTYSDGFGAVECTLAPVGTFVGTVGAMDPVPCPGAMEAGMTECPEVLALPVIEAALEPTGRAPLWWWFGGLTVVLAAGGAGFVLVQRRTGALAASVTAFGASDTTLTDIPGIDATRTDLAATAAFPAVTSPPDVLEWDEALDGALDDDRDPPPAPRG